MPAFPVAAEDEKPSDADRELLRIRAGVEEHMAKTAVAGTTITLSANKRPLKEVFAIIEEQTGNRFIDNREQAPEDAKAGETEIAITLDFKSEPFWSCVDQVLDQAGRGIYYYAGEDALSIVPRGRGEGPRFGRAVYSGPFRVEVLEIQSQRHLRQPKNKSLRLQLEVAWEPRLRPIAISQPAADLQATDETGRHLTVSEPDEVLDVEVPVGTQAAEILLPFELPPREVARIATLRGKLRALVPGLQVQFRFDDLAKAAGKTERRSGVAVTLDDVRQNNAIWEIHMRLTLDEGSQTLESHRGWVFQNISYLVGADGKHIEHAGFETTRQTQNEVGVAYLFDLPDGIEGLSWVYETPAAIVELPVEYELKDIELP
ncbi:MAG: hypothetical protein L0Z07_08325 [Planctomycetes bacterium]|nr:hypothetical protein [Planctomycetota bacterium]